MRLRCVIVAPLICSLLVVLTGSSGDLMVRAASINGSHESGAHPIVPIGAVSIVVTFNFPVQNRQTHGFNWPVVGPVLVTRRETLRALTRELDSNRPPKFWECDLSPGYTLRFRYAEKPVVRLFVGCGGAIRDRPKDVVAVKLPMLRQFARLLRTATRAHGTCHQRWRDYRLSLCRPFMTTHKVSISQ